MSMKNYIGVKEVKAMPMNILDYNKLRGWKMPENEDPSEEGYLVEYIHSPNDNMPGLFKNYISWSPKSIFEEAYDEVEGLSFGLAVKAMEDGKRVTRKGWNGKDMFIFMRPEDELSIDMIVHKVKLLPQSVKDYYSQLTIETQLDGRDAVRFTPYICMKAADDTIVNGWLASQTDILKKDWIVLD